MVSSIERECAKVKRALTFRTTNVCKKIKGKWLIVQEHNSVPVDPATAKADLQSKP